MKWSRTYPNNLFWRASCIENLTLYWSLYSLVLFFPPGQPAGQILQKGLCIQLARPTTVSWAVSVGELARAMPMWPCYGAMQVLVVNLMHPTLYAYALHLTENGDPIVPLLNRRGTISELRLLISEYGETEKVSNIKKKWKPYGLHMEIASGQEREKNKKCIRQL